MSRRIQTLSTLFVCLAGATYGAERVTLTGKVANSAGKPVEHATVIVYSAGVRQGYSTYCPTCYADCGKRTLTDAQGNFTIPSLSPDLLFDLLVARDGYLPTFVKKIDAAKPSPAVAVLNPRDAVTDPGRVVRGMVVNSHNRPVRDAVVEPQGLLLDMPRGKSSIYGTIDGLDPVAVTNEKGEFELAHAKPFDQMVLIVEARGMAPRIFTNLATGLDRHTLTVTEGATVRGRLVQDGKPVPNAELGLMARQHGWGGNLKLFGYPVPEMRIGTQEDGTFIITNVPSEVEWYAYGKMESLAARGATPIIECSTKKDNEEVDLGDIAIAPGLRVAGKVTLSDGKPISPGMRITISSERAFDSQTAVLTPEGAFEFGGLISGEYTVFASVKGYKAASSNTGKLSLDRSVTGFVLNLDPR